MSLLKIKSFSIDTTDSFTFANANVTSNLTSGNANLGNLATANYFSGNGSLLTGISATTALKIANGTSNVDIPSSGGNVTISVAGTGNVGIFTGTGANIAGYLNVTGNITGANANLGNLAVANYVTGTLTTAAQPNITSVGTLTGLTVNGDITSTGNLIVAGTTTYINSTVTDIKDPIIELGAGSNGASLSSDDGMDRGSLLHYYTGGATRDAFMGWKNSTGEFTFASNISLLNNVVTVNDYGNIKAGNANLGNLVTSNYFSGNGSLLSSITGANVTGTVSAATTAGTVTTASQPNITSVGTLSGVTATGVINLTGASNVALGAVGNLHITGGSSGQYLQTDGSGGLSWASISAGTLSNGTSNIQVLSSGNITLSSAGTSNVVVVTSTGVNVAGTFNSTGNITGGNVSGGNLVSANYISGNGSLLTSITGANVTGTVSAATTAGTVTTAAQPNITSVGSLSSLTVTGVTSISAIGNLYIPGGSANYVIKTDGAGNLSWTAMATGTGNANIAGSNTQVFFNDGGSNTLGASAALTFNKSSNTLGVTNLSVSGTTNLGAVGNVTITGGSAGYLLKTDGSGTLSWHNPTYTTVGADGFTGDGSNTAFTLSSTPTNANYTIVSVGGVVQPKSTYSLTGNVLTFSSAPPNTSLIEVQIINTGITAVSGGGGSGGLTYQGISANTTLVAGNSYIVNTSSANLTLTLPGSSTLGDLIGIIDGTGTAATHALTITGANIMGSSSDMVITTNRAAFQMVYYNSTQGWILTNV